MTPNAPSRLVGGMEMMREARAFKRSFGIAVDLAVGLAMGLPRLSEAIKHFRAKRNPMRRANVWETGILEGFTIRRAYPIKTESLKFTRWSMSL